MSKIAKHIILFQELNEHKKMLLNSRAASEEQEDPSCTLEEVERSQKDLLERDLQEVKLGKLYFSTQSNEW